MASAPTRGKSGENPALTRNRGQGTTLQAGIPARGSSKYTVAVYGKGASDPVGLSNLLPRHEREGHPMRRVATFLLAAGLVFVAAAPAVAEPPSSDPNLAAKYAASWLAAQGHEVTWAWFLLLGTLRLPARSCAEAITGRIM